MDRPSLVSYFIVGHGPPTLAGPNPKISPYLQILPAVSSASAAASTAKPRTKNFPMSFTSSCHCHPKLPLSPPTHLPHNARSSMKTNRDLLSPSTGRRPSFPLGRQATVASPPPPRRELPLGTSAIADQYGSALAAAAPAKTGDISVFLQTGAVLLLAYWIANFVVPDLISKYLGFDKINEDENSEDNERKISSEGGEEEERDRGTQANSRMTKKRGFDSTRS